MPREHVKALEGQGTRAWCSVPFARVAFVVSSTNVTQEKALSWASFSFSILIAVLVQVIIAFMSFIVLDKFILEKNRVDFK